MSAPSAATITARIIMMMQMTLKAFCEPANCVPATVVPFVRLSNPH